MIKYSISKSAGVALLGVSGALLASVALAGDFFENQGLAIRGYDPVAYFQLNKAIKGVPEYQMEHKGSVFHFSSAAHRDAFAKEPSKYAPQYNGYCAFGMASGYKAATDPTAFTFVNGKLYLNYNAEVQKKWSSDVSDYVKKADALWPTTQSQTKVIE
jgi:YHS domain-containing protein